MDESTQLSGITLGFGEQILWLTGRIEHPFDVPPDRMPPVSYWIGRLWALFFGFNEEALRSLGITMAICAAPALFLSGRLASGLWGGVFAVAFLFTSSSFVIQMVEIRAYPLLFCLAAWATYILMRLVTDPTEQTEKRNFLVLTGLLILMSYTHFYGIVMSGFVFFALLMQRIVARKSLTFLLTCAGAGLVALAGVLPFVLQAVDMTAPAAAQAKGVVQVLPDAARLVFRLIASPVLLATPAALVAALTGISVLALCGIIVLVKRENVETCKSLSVILLVLVTGLVGLTLIRSQVASFEILAPHYNLWMLPLVGVALSCGFALTSPIPRGAVRAAAVALIAAQLVGMNTLMAHKTLYSHGYGEALAARITDPERTLVIYDATGLWGAGYFPLAYLTKSALTQWLAHPDGHMQQITKSGLVDLDTPDVLEAEFETVIRVYAKAMTSRQLTEVARDPAKCRLPSSDVLSQASSAEIITFCAYQAASYIITHRPEQ